jgi:hypothetical protein
MSEDTFVRDCIGIGQMGVMCKVGILDYSGCGEHGKSRGSGIKGKGRQGGEGEDRS